MPSQSELIGLHPVSPHEIERWLTCNDLATTPTKNHRQLTGKIACDDADLIKWLGRKIFDHHHNDYRIEKLKENYKKLGFSEFAIYAAQNRKLPKLDVTKKGNCTEIILTQYIESCLQKNLIKVFKLKYNPNVDQAIKGDDTLMIDVFKASGKDELKMYLGEAKFRATPTAQVVKDIASALGKDKKPLSYSFLIDELGRDAITRDLADLLDTFIIDEIKSKGNLIYAGMLLSSVRASEFVEANLNSDNPNLVVISIGLENPADLINAAYTEAENLFNNPGLI
jgi:hypothetical protein